MDTFEESRFISDSRGETKDLLVLELKKIFDPLENEVEMIIQQGTAGSTDSTEVATALLAKKFSPAELEELIERVHISSAGLSGLPNPYEEGTFPLSKKIDWATALILARNRLRENSK